MRERLGVGKIRFDLVFIKIEPNLNYINYKIESNRTSWFESKFGSRVYFDSVFWLF